MAEDPNERKTEHLFQIPGGIRTGIISAPFSKSMAHRELLSAALSPRGGHVDCGVLSRDLQATCRCLTALGAGIREIHPGVYRVSSLFSEKERQNPEYRDLFPGESGTTLRFLLPVTLALGIPARFHMEGELARRPHEPLLQVLSEHGAQVRREEDTLTVSGGLRGGVYEIGGQISSQYISGLLFALPLLSGSSTLRVLGNTVSGDYIRMTEQVLRKAGIRFEKEDSFYRIPGSQAFCPPETAVTEGDWSNAAPFFCMGAFSESGIRVTGLDLRSAQGDRRILPLLREFGAVTEEKKGEVLVRRGELHGIETDGAQIPDLIPVLSALAVSAAGVTVIGNAERLRQKESDRIEGILRLVRTLGGRAEYEEGKLMIFGTGTLRGGDLGRLRDHRMAQAAAVLAVSCREALYMADPGCVNKSFPDFWEKLGELEVLP